VDTVARTIAVTAYTGEIGDGECRLTLSGGSVILLRIIRPCNVSQAGMVVSSTKRLTCAGKMFVHPVADVIRV
jgi:nitrogen regulatory protein PII